MVAQKATREGWVPCQHWQHNNSKEYSLSYHTFYITVINTCFVWEELSKAQHPFRNTAEQQPTEEHVRGDCSAKSSLCLSAFSVCSFSMKQLDKMTKSCILAENKSELFFLALKHHFKYLWCLTDLVPTLHRAPCTPHRKYWNRFYYDLFLVKIFPKKWWFKASNLGKH